jgi:surfeit locus 1 family protein
MRSRLLLILAFIVVALVCARLGVWQLSRLHERRATNKIALAARSAPMVVLAGIVRDSNLANRRVRAKGQYDHRYDLVMRGRQYGGVPGVEIVTPLVLDDQKKTAVLVSRGFVPSPDAFTVDLNTVREPDIDWVEGIALPIDSMGGAPVRRGPQITWARLNRQALETELPYDFYPFYIQQTPEGAASGFPRRLQPPSIDDGPHLSYTIQWFAFAVMAVIFAGIMARQKHASRPPAL